MGLGDRVGRIEDDRGPELCETCPFDGPLRTLETLRVLYPDGSEDRRRDPRDPGPLSPLCAACPYSDVPEAARPIHTIEVVRTVRADA
jgi:hypothetical protein